MNDLAGRLKSPLAIDDFSRQWLTGDNHMTMLHAAFSFIYLSFQFRNEEDKKHLYNLANASLKDGLIKRLVYKGIRELLVPRLKLTIFI